MIGVHPLHPDKVYEALVGSTSHPAKLGNLKLIRNICEERQRLGVTDFSLNSVGQAIEARGGLKSKALWNPTSKDYRELIQAWDAYAGQPKRAEKAETSGRYDDLLRNITDPASRIVIEKIIRERDTYKSERDIAKNHANLIIDKRPLASTSGAKEAVGGMTLEVKVGPGLNEIELEALHHAVSAELLRAEGWKEEKLGRIVKDLGDGRSRTVFKAGFLTALRKVIAASSSGPTR